MHLKQKDVSKGGPLLSSKNLPFPRRENRADFSPCHFNITPFGRYTTKVMHVSHYIWPALYKYSIEMLYSGCASCLLTDHLYAV